MLATQLLLCQDALAMPATKSQAKPIQCSPRGVLLVIRAEFALEEFRADYSVRLSKARRDTRDRTSAKEKRVFPGARKPHKPPNPPVVLPLTDDLKPQFAKHFQVA